MMRCLFGRLLAAIADLLPRPWMSSVRYLQEWPQVRPGKSGIAAARRLARKARNKRRAKHAGRR